MAKRKKNVSRRADKERRNSAREWKTYLTARMKNDASRRADENQLISAQRMTNYVSQRYYGQYTRPVYHEIRRFSYARWDTTLFRSEMCNVYKVTRYRGVWGAEAPPQEKKILKKK